MLTDYMTGSYLTTKDFGDEAVSYTVAAHKSQTFQDRKTRSLVLMFTTQDALVCNQTHLRTFVQTGMRHEDELVGKTITISKIKLAEPFTDNEGKVQEYTLKVAL